MKIIVFFLLIGILTGLIIPNVYAEGVPDWVKNTAGWWATDAISETEFVNSIQFLVNEGIIQTKSLIGPVGPERKSFDAFCNSNEITNYLDDTQIDLLCSGTDISYIYKPVISTSGEKKINKHGFRGPEFSTEKPFGTYRIISVGSSTTMGNSPNYNETYPSYLQEIFNQNSLTHVEVINAGLSSAYSLQEIMLIENQLLDLTNRINLESSQSNASKSIPSSSASTS